MFAVITLTVMGCNKPDNTIYDVYDNISYGAVLRTLDDGAQRTFKISDLNAEFVVNFEEQDEKYGDLLDKVNVYLTFKDNTIATGGQDHSGAKTLFSSIAANQFTQSSNGLPETTLSIKLGDALNAFNLVAGQYDGGDTFVVDLELILTDGRKFSAGDVSGTLLQSYFTSPFQYIATIVCPPVGGDYIVKMHDSYGDGWQTDDGNGGSGIKVKADGTLIAEIGMCSPYLASTYACTPWPPGTADPTSDFHDATTTVTVPAGVQELVWDFPGDRWGEISFEIYGPTSGAVIFAGAPSTAAGPLAVNYCNE